MPGVALGGLWWKEEQAQQVEQRMAKEAREEPAVESPEIARKM